MLAATLTQAGATAALALATLMTSGATPVTQTARGPFDVKLQLLDVTVRDDAAQMGRRSIDKTFHGDLEATSQGEMLSAGTAQGSGGYVAIERVTGTLAGRKGSFTLQHNATMTRGTPYLNIIVVPDSGTGELTGLTGSMQIHIDKGAHSYEFTYALGASSAESGER